MKGIATPNGRPAAPAGADEVFEIPIRAGSRGGSRATRRVPLAAGREVQVADWLADLV